MNKLNDVVIGMLIGNEFLNEKQQKIYVDQYDNEVVVFHVDKNEVANIKIGEYLVIFNNGQQVTLLSNLI